LVGYLETGDASFARISAPHTEDWLPNLDTHQPCHVTTDHVLRH